MIDDGLMQTLELISGLAVRPREPMHRHTVFRVGGPAELWLVAENEEAAVAAIKACKGADQKVKFWASPGRIVRDGGLPGIWLSLGDIACGLEVLTGDEGEVSVRVGALYPAAAVGAWAIANKRAGLESLFGRAGTIGEAWSEGALGDRVREVRALRAAKVSTCAPEKLPKSALPVWFELITTEGDPRKLAREADSRRKRRRRIGDGLPGRVFADPNRAGAAEAVSVAGLCGVRLRQARIGLIEPNNIINLGGATARDLTLLMKLVQDRVKLMSGVELKPLAKPVGRLTD